MTELESSLSATSILADYLILPEYEPIPWALKDHHVEKTPRTPSDWFGYHFPKIAQELGPAILERRLILADQTSKIIPLHINEDFFAGMLGDDKCGRTVFHKYEMQFYQVNPSTKFFEPAEQGSLKLTLSQWFIKCVNNMPGSVDISVIFTTFRSKEVLESIIERAKAVLAVDEEYFSPEGPNARNPATTPKESVRLFVDRCVTEREDSTLTFNECFERYQQYCRDQKLPSVAKNRFKEAILPHIKRRFGRGIRNDLHRFNADKCTGWYGISLVHPS
jgi:hypothetical protein